MSISVRTPKPSDLSASGTWTSASSYVARSDLRIPNIGDDSFLFISGASPLRDARLGLLLRGELAPDFVHVERSRLVDDLVERGGGPRSGQGRQQHTVADDHEARYGLNAEGSRQTRFGFGVYLAEHHVGVTLCRRLEYGGERTTRTAPGCPEVQEHDSVLHRGFEVVLGHLYG